MSSTISRGLELIEERLAELEPGSPRYEILRAARDFKAAWIELGEKLTMVLEKKLYEDWGYSTFEDYVQDELRIRKGTAYKLTRSYSFLRDKEPQMLNTSGIVGAVPQYEVTDLLRQAHESPNIDQGTYQALKETAFAPDTTRASFMREVREVDPATFKPARPTRPFAEERKALSAARKLLECLGEVKKLPASHKKSVQAIIVDLEELMSVQKAG